jgi:uncharacterized membrane protein
MRDDLERGLTWLLAGALVLSLGGVAYVAMTPGQAGDPYTEFYVLGPNGTASDYPANLSVGESGSFVVGITNHERRTVTYTVVLRSDGETLETRSVDLADEGTWEEPFTVTREREGIQRLRILLYTGASPDLDGDPADHLRLWLVPPSGNATTTA